MNRDIIKEFDIKYRVNEITHETEPYINLKVEIDDKDFDAEHGAYIEDIKLYNQDTFVNPTNTKDGVDIFNAAYNIYKVDDFQRIDNCIDELFIRDEETPQTIVDHYKKVDGDYVPLEQGDLELLGLVSYTFNNLDDNNNPKYYYYNSSYTTYQNKYVAVDYDNRKKEYFYEETIKTKIYDFKDLQNDSSFIQNFNISDDIIIVSVKIHPHPDDECQSDYIIKVIYNKAVFKKDIVMAVGEIADRCVIPMRLIDLFLRYKAFDVAIEVGDVENICRLFKIFKHAKGFNNAIEYAPCGCLKH